MTMTSDQIWPKFLDAVNACPERRRARLRVTAKAFAGARVREAQTPLAMLEALVGPTEDDLAYRQWSADGRQYELEVSRRKDGTLRYTYTGDIDYEDYEGHREITRAEAEALLGAEGCNHSRVSTAGWCEECHQPMAGAESIYAPDRTVYIVKGGTPVDEGRSGGEDQ